MATPPKNPTDGTTPPAPRKPAKPRAPSTRKPAATPAKATARKPATKAAAKPATARKPVSKRATPASKPKTATTGKKWGIAAAIGGVGAAVTAGLLALRGSTPTETAKPDTDKKAHQADGTDSSASFDAGIADEGTIPE